VSHWHINRHTLSVAFSITEEEKQYPTIQRSRLRRSSAARYDMRHVDGYDVHMRVCSSYQGGVFEKDAVQHPTCARLTFNVRGTAALSRNGGKATRK
jgi:hypothetical protein